MIRNRNSSQDLEQVAESASQWSVYVVETDRGHLYTGITTDVSRRFRQHVSGRGARCLRGATSLTLLWRLTLMDHSEALSVERRIKALSAAAKRRLITRVECRSELLSELY